MEIATYEIFQKCDSRPLVKVAANVGDPFTFGADTDTGT